MCRDGRQRTDVQSDVTGSRDSAVWLCAGDVDV